MPEAGYFQTYNYYAIVTNDWKRARDWFQEKYHDKISNFIQGHLMFIMKNGDKYRIITRAEQANGYYFIDVLIEPTYTDLLTEVKKRIR